MILKKDNVEKIVEDEVIAKAMLEKGWVELEKPKKTTRKKSEGAN
mgnify:CR=1 FL=1